MALITDKCKISVSLITLIHQIAPSLVDDLIDALVKRVAIIIDVSNIDQSDRHFAEAILFILQYFESIIVIESFAISDGCMVIGPIAIHLCAPPPTVPITKTRRSKQIAARYAPTPKYLQ